MTHQDIMEHLPENLAVEIQEDIAGDVCLSIILEGMPDDLQKMIKHHTDQVVRMYVKPRQPTILISALCHNKYGESVITDIMDESQQGPFEDALMSYVVEVD